MFLSLVGDRFPLLTFDPAHLEWNMDQLLEKMWAYLDLIRVYTKPKGEIPDYNSPVVMRRDPTVENFCDKLHKSIMRQFK